MNRATFDVLMYYFEQGKIEVSNTSPDQVNTKANWFTLIYSGKYNYSWTKGRLDVEGHELSSQLFEPHTRITSYDRLEAEFGFTDEELNWLYDNQEKYPDAGMLLNQFKTEFVS